MVIKRPLYRQQHLTKLIIQAQLKSMAVQVKVPTQLMIQQNGVKAQLNLQISRLLTQLMIQAQLKSTAVQLMIQQNGVKAQPNHKVGTP